MASEIASGIKFQFLVVRLKVQISYKDRSFIIFQFLVVRLKVQLAGWWVLQPSVFQFLVVRLKEYSWLHAVTFWGISIPCGSIKSVASLYLYWISKISIPCGSIKSLQGWPVIINFNDISIPCGSIKRNMLIVKNTLVAYFNSLWFD